MVNLRFFIPKFFIKLVEVDTDVGSGKDPIGVHSDSVGPSDGFPRERPHYPHEEEGVETVKGPVILRSTFEPLTVSLRLKSETIESCKKIDDKC